SVWDRRGRGTALARVTAAGCTGHGPASRGGEGGLALLGTARLCAGGGVNDGNVGLFAGRPATTTDCVFQVVLLDHPVDPLGRSVRCPTRGAALNSLQLLRRSTQIQQRQPLRRFRDWPFGQYRSVILEGE